MFFQGETGVLLAGWGALNYPKVRSIPAASSQQQMWERPKMHFHLCGRMRRLCC